MWIEIEISNGFGLHRARDRKNQFCWKLLHYSIINNDADMHRPQDPAR